MAAPKTWTDVTVRALTCPPDKERVEYADSVYSPLKLRVTRDGKKSWRVMFRVRGADGTKGKQEALTLGVYPMLGLKEARAKAREVFEAADRGENLKLTRNAEAAARASRAFEAVVERFVRLYAQKHQKKWKETQRILTTYAVPAWQGRLISELTRSDVNDLLDSVLDDEDFGLSRARELRKHLSKLFAWVIDRDGSAASSPMANLRRPDLAYKTRNRVLSMDEIKAVWDAAGELGYPFGTHVRLLILTGQRRNEISDAKRSWLNGSRTLEIPAENYKTGIPQVVPLSQPAREVIDALPLFNGGEYLLSTTGGARPISGFSKAKEEMDRLSGVGNWTLHDLRRSVRTHLPRLGVPSEIGERILGHKLAGVAGIYDRYSYLPEKQAALDRWAEELMKAGCGWN